MQVFPVNREEILHSCPQFKIESAVVIFPNIFLHFLQLSKPGIRFLKNLAAFDLSQPGFQQHAFIFTNWPAFGVSPWFKTTIFQMPFYFSRRWLTYKYLKLLYKIPFSW